MCTEYNIILYLITLTNYSYNRQIIVKIYGVNKCILTIQNPTEGGSNWLSLV